MISICELFVNIILFRNYLKKPMKYHLDEKNRQILDILQQDAKLSVKEIASRIQLSFTPTYERIKNMEDIVIQFHLTYCKIMKKLKNVLMIHT